MNYESISSSISSSSKPVTSLISMSEFSSGLKLIEAISKDLTSQFLKVLSTQRLMLVPFEDFERTMKACTSVFSTWDEEYEKLQSIIRDLAKRKRGDDLKIIWRLNLSHKKLQSRLLVMQNFRRQHEQLRSVISRVLSPVMTHEQSLNIDESQIASTNQVNEIQSNKTNM